MPGFFMDPPKCRETVSPGIGCRPAICRTRWRGSMFLGGNAERAPRMTPLLPTFLDNWSHIGDGRPPCVLPAAGPKTESEMPASRASKALARFTVLDLTRVRAGPTCVRQLADWGANVIKIEMPPDPSAGEPL